jgi:hypothetical protein
MINSKNVSTGSKNKKLAPGNHVVTVRNLVLQAGYNPGSYSLVLTLEGPDEGPDFQGFNLDNTNLSLGRYKGQVGYVKYQRYPYEDKVINEGTERQRKISRDQGILQACIHLSNAAGKRAELDEIEAETIEEYVEKAKVLLTNTKLKCCVAGKKYVNRAGYNEFDLYFPTEKGKLSYAAADSSADVVTYDETKHLIDNTNKKEEAIDNFSSNSYQGL